jgi:hypothetical protein
MSKRERAIQLRDLAVSMIRERGKLEPAIGDVKLMMFQDRDLRIVYRTPFQQLPRKAVAPQHAKYLAAMRGKPSPDSLPYGLDIFCPAKVLNIEWDDKGRIDVLSYKPGDWEQRLTGI